MTAPKIQLYIFLLGITLAGFVNSQRITIPLKKNSADELFVTVKYGKDQCQVNLRPETGYCTNVISEKVEIPGHCGSSFVGISSFIEGKIYSAQFQLGNSVGELLFTVPQHKSVYNGQLSLCLGTSASNGSNNALEELYLEKKIHSKTAFFYLNSANSSINSSVNDQNAIVGTLALGEPISSLSKNEFVFLSKSVNGDSTYSTSSTDSFSAFGQQFYNPSIVYINTSVQFISLDSFAYDDLISVITSRGIKVTVVEDEDNYTSFTYLNSIEQLEPLIFTLIQEDNVSTFEVSLSPSSYTKQLAGGNFQLLIKPQFYTASISIGSNILESYNLGYNLETRRILIAEKQSSQNHNFRGAHIKL